MNIFETATRRAFRFGSPQGLLTTEQLWQLPLTSSNPNKASLNDCAVQLSRAIKDLGEESFVETKANPVKDDLEVCLEVVKHIIAVRQAENAEATSRAARASQLDKIDEIIAAKKDQVLAEMSVEELEAMKKSL